MGTEVINYGRFEYSNFFCPGTHHSKPSHDDMSLHETHPNNNFSFLLAELMLAEEKEN